jgi:Ser/Thr protein kinase RdoA (MazF antagonist)
LAVCAGAGDVAARLEAALERIARAAAIRQTAGDPPADADDGRVRRLAEAVAEKDRRTREIATRLDALIEELRATLDSYG